MKASLITLAGEDIVAEGIITDIVIFSVLNRMSPKYVHTCTIVHYRARARTHTHSRNPQVSLTHNNPAAGSRQAMNY